MGEAAAAAVRPGVAEDDDDDGARTAPPRTVALPAAGRGGKIMDCVIMLAMVDDARGLPLPDETLLDDDEAAGGGGGGGGAGVCGEMARVIGAAGERARLAGGLLGAAPPRVALGLDDDGRAAAAAAEEVVVAVVAAALTLLDEGLRDGGAERRLASSSNHSLARRASSFLASIQRCRSVALSFVRFSFLRITCESSRLSVCSSSCSTCALAASASSTHTHDERKNTSARRPSSPSQRRPLCAIWSVP